MQEDNHNNWQTLSILFFYEKY